MIDTGISLTQHSIVGGDGASSADSTKNRLAVRIYTLLHAQALLRGTTGGTGGASYVEDDRRRLAARWESAHRP